MSVTIMLREREDPRSIGASFPIEAELEPGHETGTLEQFGRTLADQIAQQPEKREGDQLRRVVGVTLHSINFSIEYERVQSPDPDPRCAMCSARKSEHGKAKNHAFVKGW